jgi:N-acetylglutamate synthase-like GNAT family acetyltransferase
VKTAPAPAVIAPAVPADAAAIGALLRAAGLPAEDFADHLAHFLVARRGDAVVGAVGCELHGADALLRSLVVAPAERGAGLGGRLVDRLAAAVRRRGARQFYLLTTTAEAFFGRRGFRRIDRAQVPPALGATREFQSLCPASAVCLARPVTPAARP